MKKSLFFLKCQSFLCYPVDKCYTLLSKPNIIIFLCLSLCAIIVEYFRYGKNLERLFDNSSENRLFDLFLEKKWKIADDLATKYSRTSFKSTELFNKLAITIISQERKTMSKQYLPIVVWSLVHLIKSLPSNAPRVNLFLCNIDIKGENYTTMHDLTPQFTVFRRYNISDYSPLLAEANLKKETMDYAFCLQSTLNYKSEYVLLVEDDALAKPIIFSVIFNFLKNNKRPFTYLKLYHPQRLLGFIQPEIDRIVELIGLSSLCCTIIILVIAYRTQQYPKLHTWIIIFLYSLLINIILGRRWVLWLRGLHPCLHYVVSAPFCCTQGMLYPSSVAQDLVKELQTGQHEKAIDKLIYNFRATRSEPAWYIQPNLLTHVGRHTTMRDKVIDAGWL